MKNRPIHLLANATRSFAVGDRPLSQRPCAHWLRQSISKGLLGVVLASAAVAGAHAHDHVAQAGTLLPQVSASAAQSLPGAEFAPSAFSRKSSTLSWVNAAGQVDGLELINQWKAGGITADQAFELVNILVMTQSPVIVRTTGARAEASAQSLATQSIFEVRTPSQAETFLKRNNREELVLRGLVHSSEGENAMEGVGRNWTNVVNYWQIMSSDRLDEITSLPGAIDAPQDMAHARAALLAAVDEAGLASLRVPLPAWNDSANLEIIAQRITQANRELQSVTGWSGQVLGLRDRVSLTVISPLNLSKAFPKAGGIGIASTWEDLSHEWIHALDFSLRTAPGDTDKLGGLTFSDQVKEMGATTPLARLWHDLPVQLRAQSQALGGTWYRDRDERVAKLSSAGSEDAQWNSEYLSSTHETLAFAWQSYVQATLSKGSAKPVLADQVSKINANNGVMGPLASEAPLVAPVWKATFDQLGQQWWSPPPQSTFAAKLQARRAPSLIAQAPSGPHP